MTRACLHLGVHEHPVKVGEDQEIKERMRKLIEEQIERITKATNSAIVMEASSYQGCHADIFGRTDGRSDDGPGGVRDLDAL
jgi:hypothetical protein